MQHAREIQGNGLRGSARRALLGPGIMALVMLAILLALGTWQVRRLHWKEGILARIAAAEAAPPTRLTAHPGPFAKVFARGEFRGGRIALYGVAVHDTPQGPLIGADQIVPLREADGTLVLVDRGWVPTAPGAPPTPVPDGPATVEGYVRAPERPTWFGVGDDLVRRQFFTLDPGKIGAALGIAHVAPFVLVAMGSVAPGIYPIPATHFPEPPNNHLQYAITWYGLAIALVVIFVEWSRKRLNA